MTAPDSGPSFAVQRFTWGPGHSYIWYAGSFIGPGGKEDPHFEGMLVWNGVHKNLDMLLTMDLKSGRAQEQGTFNVVRTERSCVRYRSLFGRRCADWRSKPRWNEQTFSSDL